MHAGSQSVKLVKAGAELYGGLGDSVLGLTLNPNVTAQYIGLNLKTEFANGAHIMLGAATGLTGQSEHALVRLIIGYEFK